MARSAFRFVLPHRVRYAEVDAQGIVFFGNYLTFFDNAMTDYFRQFGFAPATHAKNTGADFHIVKADIDYRAPVPLDAEIDICVRAARIGRSSLTFAGEIHPRDAEDCRASVTMVWVYTDQTTRKSTPLPDSFRAGILAYEGGALAAAT